MHSLTRAFPFSLALVRFFFIAVIVCPLFSVAVPRAQAASLTEPQIQAILNLLVSFDVGQTTIDGVSAILHGTTPPVPTNSIIVTAPNGGEQ